MHSSFAARMGVVILLIFVSTALAGTLLKPGVDALVGASDWVALKLRYDAVSDSYDFGRVLRRVFMLMALVVVLSTRKWLGTVELLGMRRVDRRGRFALAGFAAGVVSWLLLVSALVVAGRRGIRIDQPDGFLFSITAAFAGAVLVGFIEELALRGYVLGGLKREWPVLPAVFATSSLYSILHFLRTPTRFERGFDPLAGFTTLAEHFGALANPGVIWGFIGLLLVGVVLSYAYLWTRSLPFAIGLHAGWVFLMQTEVWFVDGPTGTRAIYGPGGILTDEFGWGFLMLVLASLFLVTRRR